MDYHHSVQTLRLHLLNMTRVCQRGVDYSTKAYKLANSECCFSVQDDRYEIDILHREILEFSRDLMLVEISEEPVLRFVLSADRICNALKAIHVHAADIAASSMRLLQSSRAIGCRELISMGDFLNGLMRLCVVALFEEENVHAEDVLRKDGVERRFQRRFFNWFKTLDPRESTQAGYDVAIAKSLSQMSREIHEMAHAILFWLDGSEYEHVPGNLELRMMLIRSYSGEN